MMVIRMILFRHSLFDWIDFPVISALSKLLSFRGTVLYLPLSVTGSAYDTLQTLVV
jgi:hypothetical protein